MKLLQVPTANLEERVKEELEENPALEVGEDGHDDFEDGDDLKSDSEEDYDAEVSADEYDNIDLSDYVHEGDDEVGDYKLRDENYPEMDEGKVIPIRVETSFHEMLLNQLGMMELDERTQKISEQIVGSIDDDGYLRREISSISDDLAFRQNIVSSEIEIEGLIKKIQQFDPPGICARDLKECLILQLSVN
jgi:RNA polymerase sigma-54 factor